MAIHWRRTLHDEYPLLAVIATLVIYLAGGTHVLSDDAPLWWMGVSFAWLFCITVWAAVCAVRHAEGLAIRLGEPYGTLILTLSVIVIEISTITLVMLHGANNPTLASDTMFAVVMIIMNGIVGLSLLMGALRHREQQYNLQGAHAYLSAIVVLCVLGLVLPTFVTGHAALSPPHQVFQIVLTLSLYLIFLFIQTTRHRDYFTLPKSRDHAAQAVHARPQGPLPYHAILLVGYLVPVVLLAKKLAIPIDYPIETLGAPAALGGLIVACLVSMPEGMEAVRAARGNQLQRSVNVLLGSVLATISLTIPAILIVGLLTHHDVYLGLDGPSLVLLLATLAVSIITFSGSRTNVLQGCVHLLLLLAYLLFVI